jgi:CHRD domain
VRASLALAAVLALAFVASAARAGNVVLKATLTGKYLHTTSTGSGTATITFTASKVCWKFTYKGLDQAGDSGVHIVPPPPPGKHKTSVFPFTAATSTAPGCVAKNHWGAPDAAWADKIVADPHTSTSSSGRRSIRREQSAASCTGHSIAAANAEPAGAWAGA